MDVQKPLRRGIFISKATQEKVWIPFKYEMLLNFCFGCGRIGHGTKECTELFEANKDSSEEEFPYSSTLQAESDLMGKESMLFGNANRKKMKQCSYTSESDYHKQPNGVNSETTMPNLATTTI